MIWGAWGMETTEQLLAVKLMELPDNYKGLLFIERGSGINFEILNKICKDLKIKSRIGFIHCHNVEGIKLLNVLGEE